MLNIKMFRDIKKNKSQFLTIFLMAMIGIMVYVGIEAYMTGMTHTSEKFYSENNLQDLNVIGENLTKDDLKDIKAIDNVKDAERKLVLTGTNPDEKDTTYLISFIESNNISKFYIVDGEKFNKDKKGVWVDNFYAEENNLKVGDTIKIKYDTFTLEEKIIGLINVPDHIYDVKDSSELFPNRKEFGFIYLSSNEIPSSYIESMLKKQMNLPENIDLKQIKKDFDYKDYIPYNYIMVDVNKKSNVNNVKNDIEDNVTNALGIVKIEDSLSYSMYQGEIDEGKAYIGIFSGLFLFIAMLSVITTMTRVIKQQKLEIGTLKALGFKKSRISLHYINYGFIISLLAAIASIILGRYFIGNVFIGMEMSFFEIPNGKAVIEPSSYLVAALVILGISFITYLTCLKELRKKPAESLRNELPKVKNKNLNITTKGIFKHLPFSTKWNIRDIIRNKIRTITGVIGIVGCCTLIVCAVGMLNSMNRFINLQFEDLYNFKYKLTLKENLSEKELKTLIDKYGNYTSETLNIEIKDNDNNRTTNTIFITDAKDKIRFQNPEDKYIKLNNDTGVYITRKLSENTNLKVGDTIKWHIYGNKTYYNSKIAGITKDPQQQNIVMTRKYLESLNIDYKPDSLYTNNNLKNIKEINNVSLIQNKSNLKFSMESMLSMMRKMIILIIVIACLLGSVIIYNMGILSYSEKQYQFATLKVLGFKDKQIKNIFIEQNIWITIISILIGLPSGYYLTSWLFKKCLDDNFDFNVYIKPTTYVIATLGTFLVSYLVSLILSKKIKKIDMVSSLKGNE